MTVGDLTRSRIELNDETHQASEFIVETCIDIILVELSNEIRERHSLQRGPIVVERDKNICFKRYKRVDLMKVHDSINL